MERIPTNKLNSNFVVTLYFFFKAIPTFVSAMAIYLGYKLFLLGVTGQASLSIEHDKVSGQLLNAAPGLFFAVGGLVVLGCSVFKGVQMRFMNNDPSITTRDNDRMDLRL